MGVCVNVAFAFVLLLFRYLNLVAGYEIRWATVRKMVAGCFHDFIMPP